MFTFEFDAPKYKCFGGNQPRRSTLTAIDQNSSNDRWFLYFDRPKCWQQMFQSNIMMEKHNEEKVDGKDLINNTQVQEVVENQVQQQHNSQKIVDQMNGQKQHKQPSLKKQKSNKKTQLTQKSQSQHQILPNNNYNRRKNMKITSNQQTNKILPINKNQPLRQPLYHQIPKLNPQKTQIGHKIQLKSMDSKNLRQNKIISKQKETQRRQNIQPSKSQPVTQKVNKDVKAQQKKRNTPCFFPIRVQRQWQQDHGKKWYQLTGQQLQEAEKSMQKRLDKYHKYFRQQYENQTKFRQNIPVSKTIKINPPKGKNNQKLVKNPLHESRLKESKKSEKK